MRRSQLWLIALLVFGSGVNLGCSEPQACTLAGCHDGLAVTIGRELLAEVDAPFSVELCVDGACELRMFEEGWVGQTAHLFQERSDLRPGETVAIEVRIEDDRGRIIERHAEVEMREVEPNGPRCPPTCVVGGAEF